MAVKKATTTDDLTAEAKDVSPTLEQQVEQVGELTDPAMLAEVQDAKTVKVKSPFGAVTEVPEGIVAALLDSGYSKSK
jgi:hypothetical protein